MTLFQLLVLMLPFSLTSSGRRFTGFLVMIKTPGICVTCAFINEIMLFGMISELQDNQVPFFVLLGVFAKIYHRLHLFWIPKRKHDR